MTESTISEALMALDVSVTQSDHDNDRDRFTKSLTSILAYSVRNFVHDEILAQSVKPSSVWVIQAVIQAYGIQIASLAPNLPNEECRAEMNTRAGQVVVLIHTLPELRG